MLASIWAVLGNYNLDLPAIAEAMKKLIFLKEDGTYGGNLEPLIEVPVVGEILKAFASFSPSAPIID